MGMKFEINGNGSYLMKMRGNGVITTFPLTSKSNSLKAMTPYNLSTHSHVYGCVV